MTQIKNSGPWTLNSEPKQTLDAELWT